MSIVLDLPAEIERELIRSAVEAGQSVSDYTSQLVVTATRKTGRTWAEVVAPITEEFKERGMSEEELDELVEGVRQEIWNEQQAGRHVSS